VAPTLNLIGAGHVGRVLARLFAQSGAFTVQDVLTRSQASAQAALAFIGAGNAAPDLAAMRRADAWMLAVGDDQIVPVARQLAARADLDDALVFHCSGAKAADALAVASARGALAASVHPVRSFADPATVAALFAGTFCGIEGEPQALARLEPALAAIGARPVRIASAGKTVYHAAAVFASNYLVTVMDAALRAYEAAGVPPEVARELAAPLATETLANVLRLGPGEALSGPIARGDADTVARQQAALDAWDRPTGDTYRALATATWALARRRLPPSGA
jgi:predicted short-subunit dehydrogenase-like oxidoreductase (DUF2520 family)